MNDLNVTVTRTIHAPVKRVWQALTRPADVAKWMMGAKVESDWTPGAPITWRGEYDGKPFEDTGEVIEVEPGKRLKHTHASGSAGPDATPNVLTWTLAGDDDATRLTLVQSGATSQKEAEAFRKNWSAMLDALKDVAES